MGRFQEAAVAAEEGLKAEPSEIRVVLRLTKNAAVSKLNQGDYGNAIVFVSKALTTLPHYLAGYQCLLSMAGVTDPETAGLENPVDPNLIAELELIRAHCHLHLRERDNALETARSGLAAKPTKQALIDDLNLILRSPEKYFKRKGGNKFL